MELLEQEEWGIMTRLTHEVGTFGSQMREFFRKQALGCRSIRVGRHCHVYTSGQRDAMVYFIESGQVKLLLPSVEGKECILAVRTAGEIFGELCLSGQISRLETAVAMQDVGLKQMPARSFLMGLKQESLLEGLIQYLTVRIAEQQRVIAELATENCEHRLARTLLYLGERHGRIEARGTRIGLRLSHEELSAMVGTTRPRIGIFLKKFRALGLLRLNEERCLVIEETKLEDYLLNDTSAEHYGGYGSRRMEPNNPKSQGLVPESSAN